MSPYLVKREDDRYGVPRASGDEPGQAIPGVEFVKCSPRERG